MRNPLFGMGVFGPGSTGWALMGQKAFLQKRTSGAGAQDMQGDAEINGFVQP